MVTAKVAIGGDSSFNPFCSNPYTELASRLWYRKHNTYVRSVRDSGFEIHIPYHPGYKAMAVFPVQGHTWPYIEYKAMAL